MTNFDFDQRDLEAFANGTMLRAERDAFQRRLDAEPALRERLETYRFTQRGFDELRLRHHLQANHLARQAVGGTRPLWGRRLAVAASLAVLLLAGYFGVKSLLPTPYERLFNDVYQPAGRLRGTEPDDCRAQAQRLREGYLKGTYEEVVGQTLTPAQTSSPCVQYYRGLSYLALRQPANAQTALQTAQRSPDAAIRQSADWYLSLAYLLAEAPDRVRAQLRAIEQEAGHPYAEPARQLQRRLE